MEDDKELLYENLNRDTFLDFYNSFNSVIDLIKFLRSRKRPEINIFRVVSDESSEITAVIPTSTIKNKLVKLQIEKFRGVNLVFVESSGPYFNFSHSMNAGIDEAIRLNSKYIMLSNDDVFPTEDLSYFQKEVVKNDMNYDILIPTIVDNKGFLSPRQKVFSQTRLIEYMISKNIMRFIYTSEFFSHCRSLLGKLDIYSSHDILKYIILRDQDPLISKNRINQADIILERVFEKLNPPLIEFHNIQPVSFIKADILKGEKFDETFVNGGEDTDLSIRLANKGVKVGYIQNRFQNIGGYSMGQNIERFLKNTIPEILILGYKLKKYFPLND